MRFLKFSFILLSIFCFVLAFGQRTRKKAEKAYEKGEFSKSIILYNQLLEKDSKNPEYYFFRGVSRVGKYDWNRAEKDFTNAIEYGFVPFFAPYNQRGKARIELEMYDDAISDLEASIQLEPEQTVAYVRYAEALTELKRFDEAKGMLRKAELQDSTDWEIPFKLGYISQLNADFQKALYYYTKAENLSGRNPYIQYNRGFVFHSMKQYENACDEWRSGCIMHYEKNCKTYSQYCVEEKKRRPKKE